VQADLAPYQSSLSADDVAGQVVRFWHELDADGPLRVGPHRAGIDVETHTKLGADSIRVPHEAAQ
jgi:hypothetical protein